LINKKLRKEFGNEIFICNAGAISTGAGVLASRALGADLAYLGTRFIPTFESEAQSEYKQMLVDSKTGPAPNFLPTIYTDKISGVYANFLIDSVKQHTGSVGEKVVEDFSNLDSSLKWKKIWSAGHGTLNIHDISSVHDVVDTLYAEFNQAKLNIQ
jgi:nitronate monooxygenase